jgi:hypothetical protein
MITEVTITNITGQSPFDIYICQPDGSGCFYIDTINNTSYDFQIPSPFDTLNQYMLKVIDNKGCVITGVASVGTCP